MEIFNRWYIEPPIKVIWVRGYGFRFWRGFGWSRPVAWRPIRRIQRLWYGHVDTTNVQPGTVSRAVNSADQSEGQPRVLCYEPDGRWALRHTGDGPAVHTSEPMGIIDATFWAGELIGAGNGAWKPVDEYGPLHHPEGDRWEPNAGPVYRWQPGTER